MEEKELIKSRSYFVVKDNRLITHSRYSLSLQQQKLLLYFISRIKPLDEAYTEYIFDIKEFLDICGYSRGGSYYQNIKKDIKELGKPLWIELENGSEELFWWIRRANINPRSGKIVIGFDYSVSHYLFGLKEKYTQYSLYNVLCLSHKYAIRLYEYLMVYKQRGTVTVDISELRKRVDAEQSTYDKLSNLKNKIIKPSIEDINKYTDIYVDYDFLKPAGSREYTQIQFTIRYKTIDESVYANLASNNRLDPDTRKRSRELEKRLQVARQARKDLEEIDDEDLPD